MKIIIVFLVFFFVPIPSQAQRDDVLSNLFKFDKVNNLNLDETNITGLNIYSTPSATLAIIDANANRTIQTGEEECGGYCRSIMFVPFTTLYFVPSDQKNIRIENHRAGIGPVLKGALIGGLGGFVLIGAFGTDPFLGWDGPVFLGYGALGGALIGASIGAVVSITRKYSRKIN